MFPIQRWSLVNVVMTPSATLKSEVSEVCEHQRTGGLINTEEQWALVLTNKSIENRSLGFETICISFWCYLILFNVGTVDGPSASYITDAT